MSPIVRLVVFVAVVLVLLPFHSLPLAAGTDDRREMRCVALPLTIQVHQFLEPAVRQLACRSETFQRQVRLIAAAGHVRISLVAVPAARFSSAARATTTIGRYSYGLLRALVEIPLPSEQHELIVHELEHVLEQVEGLDLPALARAGDAGVSLVGKNVFETTRAQAAGRAAAREVTAPLIRTMARGR